MSETHEKVATVQEIFAELSALTIDTRGKLAAIGGKIRSYAKASGLETNKAIVDNLTTQFQLQGKKLDASLVGRCLKAHSDRGTANKLNVYEAWSKAESDKDAQGILDVAQGKVRKPATVKSDLQKAIAAIDRLDLAGIEAIASHLESRALALAPAKASVKAA